MYLMHGVYKFSVDPSSGSTRAIRAYQKLEFYMEEGMNPNVRADDHNTIIMIIKRLMAPYAEGGNGNNTAE